MVRVNVPLYLTHTGMERWAGRVALITGASAGIGAALAERLVQYGMKVVGCSRNVEAIEVSDHGDSNSVSHQQIVFYGQRSTVDVTVGDYGKPNTT